MFKEIMAATEHNNLKSIQTKKMRNKLQPCSLLFSELSFYPLHHHSHGIMLFLIGQFSTSRYTMPFFETTSATTPSGMLSYKHRMPAHGSLFTIVGNHGRSQSFTNKIGGMTGNRIHSFFFQLRYFLSR